MSNIPIYEFPENEEQVRKMLETVENDLGYNDMNMRRDRPYSGQSHTNAGERGKTEIKGVTFRDLKDSFIRAAFLSSGNQFPDLYEEACKGEDAALCENDLYKLDWEALDSNAVIQNLSCEIERIMGIFPNTPELFYDEQG